MDHMKIPEFQKMKQGSKKDRPGAAVPPTTTARAQFFSTEFFDFFFCNLSTPNEGGDVPYTI